MSRLFISYAYIARNRGIDFQGFENMICPRLIFPPQDDDHIEALTAMCEEHCRNELGVDGASATILWWKEMDGT